MVFLLISCGKSSTPVNPPVGNDSPDLMVISQSSDNPGSGGNKISLGFWNIVIDPESGTIDAVPMRSADLTVNITPFLQPGISLGRIQFQNLDMTFFFDQGLIDLDIGFTHPFPGLDQYICFDVLGVFYSGGTYISQVDSSVIYGSLPNDAVLLNPDGYTRWYNAVEFPLENIFGYVPWAFGTHGWKPSATINSFKYFADDLDPEDDVADFYSDELNAEHRGRFRSTSTNFRRYSIEFPMFAGSPVLEFQLGMFANWEEPEGGGPYNYENFPPEANMPEALILNADASDSTIYWEDGSSFGGTLSLDLEILDQQSLHNVDGVTGEIAGIFIESQNNCIPGGFVEFDNTYLSGNGVTNGPLSSVYSFEIQNCTPSSQNDVPVLIHVLSEDPSDYDYGLGDEYYPVGAALTSFFLLNVPVLDETPDLPPVGGEITYYWDHPGDPCAGLPVTFEISEAYDPDGLPVTITWDFDGDMSFDDDTDGDDSNLSAIYTFGTPGIYEAWCRIDDGTLHTDIGPYAITVLDCPPIGGEISFFWDCDGDPCPGHEITFEISEAYDPYGLAVTITWDFDGNLDFMDDLDGDDTNLSGTYIFSTPGNVDIWCRIDNGAVYTDVGPFTVEVIDCTLNMSLAGTTPSAYRCLNTTYDDENKRVYASFTDWGASAGHHGLYIFDVDPPEEPEIVGSVTFNLWMDAMAYREGYCYEGGYYGWGIKTIDVDPPESAAVVSTTDNVLSYGAIYDMVTYDDFLYVCYQWNGMRIYNIANDPEHPEFIGTSGPPIPSEQYNWSFCVEVSTEKEFGFIGPGHSSLSQAVISIDISNKSNPLISDRYDVPSAPIDMKLDGDWLYVLVGSSLYVFDITDPTDMILETTLPIAGNIDGLCMDGNYLFTQSAPNFTPGKFYAIDVSDPTSPSVVYTYDLTGTSRCSDVNCGIAYVPGFDYEDGVFSSIYLY